MQWPRQILQLSFKVCACPCSSRHCLGQVTSIYCAVAADEPLHTDFLDVPGVEAAPLLAKHGKKKGSQVSNDILYGIINAIVGAPTMISFAAIIFQVL